MLKTCGCLLYSLTWIFLHFLGLHLLVFLFLFFVSYLPHTLFVPLRLVLFIYFLVTFLLSSRSFIPPAILFIPFLVFLSLLLLFLLLTMYFPFFFVSVFFFFLLFTLFSLFSYSASSCLVSKQGLLFMQSCYDIIPVVQKFVLILVSLESYHRFACLNIDITWTTKAKYPLFEPWGAVLVLLSLLAMHQKI